jgi:diadenosine tetraphosphatase ApaH/serine/threonine PP2A family protein phosphatase
MEALLYDVHGNLPALEAVLADARPAGVSRWILGGDYALFGGWPAETVARLRELEPAVWIRGNGERWTDDPVAAPDQPVIQAAIEAARSALGAELVAHLGRLPAHADDGDSLICHGSPISDVRSFSPEPADDDDELMGGVTPARIVFGHTHLPFRREAGAVELVNPGSVGMPFDGDPRAAYALVHPDGSIEHRRVAYDHLASARRVREAFGGANWTDTVAKRIERSRMDVD